MNFTGRSFLKLKDFTPEEITYLVELGMELKQKKKQGIAHDELKGKNIALIFEKTSTRTRCSFEVAAYDLGMHVTYLDPSSSQIGKKKASKTLQGYWAECMTESNTGGSVRKSWKNWQNTPAFRCGTA